MKTKRISTILTVLNLFLFAGLAVLDAQAASYRFTTLDAPGAFYTHPRSINASGQVTGYYYDDVRDYGFVYSGGTFTTLDAPGATKTFAYSINASGQVTGFYQDVSDRNHGFVYSNGTFTILNAPGAIETSAISINDSGQVTGYYWDGSGTHGFVYSNGTFTTFDTPDHAFIQPTSINASGQVTGYYTTSVMPRLTNGFVYSGSAFKPLDIPGQGLGSTLAASINDSGQVTGSYCNVVDKGGCHGSHGFVYSGDTFTTFDVPDATHTEPSSINNGGQVAGYYLNGSGYHGFLYSNGMITKFDVPGANGTEATSINVSGQVAGSYWDGSHRHGFIATPVCETPTVTVETLTGVPQGGFRLTGSITREGAPLCALVLANGQSMFTCGGSLPKGDFDLTVPLDDQRQITLFGFSAGLLPYQQTFGPDALPVSANVTGSATSCSIPKVTYTTTAASQGKFRITGSITHDDAPLCALVLANGQSMFTCGDPLGKGSFDLTVPPDDQGKITLFGFVAGLEPFQQTLGPGALPAPATVTVASPPR
ncbi:MAG: hypothetical protein P9F19_17525 [Candidatus Contendobacter sp.]|nr:hypothetical protein [Candidatus Contendobacter sp.]MDG4559169.1 hypothetical protein [Candidatus Contendobacter sp.]